MLSLTQESYESSRLACGLEAQVSGFTAEMGQDYYEMFLGLILYQFSAELCSLAHYRFMLEYMGDYTVKDCMTMFSILGNFIEERLSDAHSDLPTT